MSSGWLPDCAYVSVPWRLLRISARKSPTPGVKDQTRSLMCERSSMKDNWMNSLNTSVALRRSPASTDCSTNPLVDTRDAKISGCTRMNAASNSASSTSSPLKIRTWPRSASGCGEKFITPSPNSTSPVTPASVSATKADPLIKVSDRSSPRTTTLSAAYWVVVFRVR